jgi:hypothetical protein
LKDLTTEELKKLIDNGDSKWNNLSS